MSADDQKQRDIEAEAFAVLSGDSTTHDMVKLLVYEMTQLTLAVKYMRDSVDQIAKELQMLRQTPYRLKTNSPARPYDPQDYLKKNKSLEQKAYEEKMAQWYKQMQRISLNSTQG